MSTLGTDNPFLGAAAKQITEASVATLALLTTTILLAVTYAAKRLLAEQKVDGVRHIKQVVYTSLNSINTNCACYPFFLVLSHLCSIYCHVKTVQYQLFHSLIQLSSQEHQSLTRDNCQKKQTAVDTPPPPALVTFDCFPRNRQLQETPYYYTLVGY